MTAPRIADARSLPSLDAAGGPALRYSPIVSLSDTFLVAGFGFQDLAGNCKPRGWVGEDRVSRIFAHPDSRFVVNQSFFTGLPGSINNENLTGLISTTALRAPRALAVDDSGRVIFSDEGFGQKRLFKAYPATDALTYYGSFPTGSSTALPGSAVFNRYTRTVIASDEQNGTLVEIAAGSTGTVIAGQGSSPDDGPVATASIGSPTQIAIDLEGMVYFVDPATSRARRINDGYVQTIAGSNVGLSGPTGIALDPVQSVLFISDTGNHRVLEIDIDPSHELTYQTIIHSTPVYQPGALAYDPFTFALYIASGDQILRLVLDGHAQSVVAGGGGYGPPSGAALGTQQNLVAPTGLTPDGAGGVYFTDPPQNLVFHLLSNGDISVVAGLPAAMEMGNGALWFGTDAANDPDEVATWVKPTGYGNNWSQRLVSTSFSYTLHPDATIQFDAALDLGSNSITAPQYGAEFMAVQAQKPDGSWAFVNARLLGAGAPASAIQTFAGHGLVSVLASLSEDGNNLLGLAGTTRFRIVVQTSEESSSEDGVANNPRGAAVVDNIQVRGGSGPILEAQDFEAGLVAPWSLAAMNGVGLDWGCQSPAAAAGPESNAPINPCQPYTRDVPAPNSIVDLRPAFDPQDPTCVWTFLSPGDSLASGTFARITSPWFAMAPSDSQLLISFSGKLNTEDQTRYLRVFVRGKNAGDTSPRFLSVGPDLLNSGTQGGDEASPYINQRVLNYLTDFDNPQAAESLQVVFQVEDRGESTYPGRTLDNRPRTALPYLDDIRFYQLNVDSDHDGVPDAWDLCPTVCAAGQDGDGDGCPDPTATLRHVESWARGSVPIHYTIAQGADPANPTPNDASEIQFGFNAWTDALGCSLTVVRDADLPVTAASPFDGINLVTFQDPDFQFPDGVLAVTPTFSFTRRAVFDDHVVLPGQIVDADMIFNPASHFSTPGHTPAGTSFDLRSVTTHEAGHLFGISHSGVLHSTMFFVLQDDAGAASLEADDKAAIGAAYPLTQFTSSLGAILGSVTRGGTEEPLPGALVTAVLLGDVETPPDSVASDYTDEQGRFALRGLQPGSYGVRLTPLDGEVGGFPLTPDFISARVADGAQTNFPAEWYGGPESASDNPDTVAPISVSAGVVTSGIDIISNIDTTPPFVITSLPAAGATGVRPDATILIKFSERIDPQTLNGAFRLHLASSPGTSLGGQALLINGGRTVIFNPTNVLLLDETYVLDVTGDVKDRQGVPLSPLFSATFQTLTSGAFALGVSDVEPRAAATGSYVTVLGGGFDPSGSNSVLFSVCSDCSATPVPAFHVTPTSMVVQVPPNAATGPVRAVVNASTSNLSPPLRVLAQAPQVAPSRVTDIALNFAPTDVALSPDGAYAYAVGAGGLATINLTTRIPSYKTIGAASHIAITPDGRRALITQPALGHVLDVDADHTSLTLGDTKATIPVGLPGTPDGVTISPSGRRGYVTDQTAGLIYVIDMDASSATRDSVIGELADSVAILTGGVAVLATGDEVLYTSGNAGSRFRDVDSPDAALAHPGASAGGVAATPSAGEALFTGTGAFGGELLSVLFAGRADGFISQIDVGGNLRDVVVAPQGQSALAVNSADNLLQVVGVDHGDPASYHEVAAQAGTGASPVAVSQSEDGGVIAVANFGSRTIGIYRTGGSAGLVRAIPPVARPGDRVALQATGTPFGVGSQVDLGDGPFAISYRAPSNAAAAFVTPAGPQREATLSALDPAGTRTLALGFRVVEPIPSLTPHASGFDLPLPSLGCFNEPFGLFDVMRGSPDGRLLALVRNPGVCPIQLELFAVGDEDPSEFGQRLSRGTLAPPDLAINDMAFTTDGRQLWAINTNLNVRVMNTDRSSAGFGSLLGVLTTPGNSNPGGVAADPLGRYMCVGSFVTDTVRFYSPIFTSGMIPLSRTSVQGTSEALAASPDGRVLVAAGGGRARFVNLETRALIGVSALHGLTTTGSLRFGVGIPTRGTRAVVRFTNGIGVYNLDAAVGAVGAELYFGNPFLSAGAIPYQLAPGPGGDDVIATCSNCDSLIHINTSVIPPAVSYAPIGQRANAITATPDGRQLWIGETDGSTFGNVGLWNLSSAAGLALVAGGGQSGLAGTTLPQAVVVRVADGTGHPETGVVVRFALTSGTGSLDHDSSTVYHLTDANGEARVSWTLPATLGTQDLAVTALGVAGGTLDVSAAVVPDNSQIPPAVLAFGPPNGSSDFNTGTPVFIRFNQAMDPATTTPRVKLFANGGPIAGDYHFEQNGTFVLFQPTQPLGFAARCSLSVVPGALDSDGQLLGAGGYSVFHVESAPPLAVNALSPPAAAVGSPVVLEGTGFNSIPSQNAVLFNQVPTTVIAASPTSITAPVPPGATSGPVTVQVGSGKSPDVNFTVLEPSPPITTVSDSIPAGPTATRVVITPDGARCYVTNPSSNSVTAIDLTNAVTLAVITVGLKPSGIALLPDGSRAYVCNQNSDDVSVIDIKPGSPGYHTVVNTIPVGHQPRDIAVSPFGPEVVVVEYGSATLSVIDANSGNATFDEVTTTTNTGVGGTGIGITPDGGRAYVCTSGGTIVKFDLKTGAVTTTTNTGVGGTAIGITPDGALAIVLLENGQLLGINIVPGSSKENAVTTTTNTGVGGGGGVSISPDGGSAYVSNTDGNVVFVFSIVSGSAPRVSLIPGPAVTFVKVDSIPVGQAPLGIAIDPHLGRFGLVANSGSGTLSVLGVLGNGPPPLEVIFKFTPNSLNLKSMGHWVTGTIEPPPAYDVHDIDVASLRLNGVVAVDPDAPASIGANGPTSENQIKVRFPRSQVELVVAEGDAVPVTVTGMLGTRRITGTDHIKVKRGKVTSPIAGALLLPGHAATVRWTTPSGVNAQWVAVLHSFDRGLNWTLDATHLPNSGSYQWLVPLAVADSAKVAVALVESGDTTGVDVNAVLGVSDYFKIWGTTDVEAAPVELVLSPVRPNPAGGRALLRFGLPRAADVRLEIYDLQGRRVRTLARGPAGPGWHEITWTGRIDGGIARAGVYFVRFQAEGREFEKRLVWLR